MVKLNELRKLNKTDLITKFHDLDKEIALETFNIHSRKSNKTAALRVMKKDRARIATVLSELNIINEFANNEQ